MSFILIFLECFNDDFYAGRDGDDSESSFEFGEIGGDNTVENFGNKESLFYQNEDDDDDPFFVDESYFGQKKRVRRKDGSKAKVWHVEYYMQYFDIDSVDILWRCLFSLIPLNHKFADLVQGNPDLWGPFWVSDIRIF